MGAMRGVVVTVLVWRVSSHGAMHIPIPRNNAGPEYPTKDNHWGNGCLGNSCLWWNGGCYIGCAKCSGTHVCETVPSDPRKDECPNPMEPTLPDHAKTVNFYAESTYGDWSKYNPWRAPGYAPVESSCGMAGAYWDYPDSTMGGQPVSGYPTRTPGQQIEPNYPEKWSAGSVVEVGWQIRANHGGGYQYRLCPKWVEHQPEDCFQKYVLPFTEDQSIIRYLDGSRADFDIPAVTVSQGTWPEGSAWRRNPIPNCLYGVWKGHPEEVGLPDGTTYTPHANCPEGCSFEPAWEEGCGTNSWVLDQVPFAIVDHVQLPETPGEYLLSWRWDSEQTAQVWANCADVVLNPVSFNPWAIAIKDIAAKCIDLPGGDTTNGNEVWIWDCLPGSGFEQQWNFEPGTWQISYNQDPSKCLDLPGGDVTNGNRLWIWDCATSSGGWGYDWQTSGIYSTVDNSKCLDLAGGGNNNGNPLQIWDCDAGNIYGQRWIVPHSSEKVSIGSQCIDVPGGDIANGAKLWLWECNAGMNQAWTWVPSGHGQEVRYGPHMMKCLDLTGGDTTNGNQIELWDCDASGSSENQQWDYDSASGTIFHVASGKCIDGGDFKNGNPIMIWDCNGQPQQSWSRGAWGSLRESWAASSQASVLV